MNSSKIHLLIGLCALSLVAAAGCDKEEVPDDAPVEETVEMPSEEGAEMEQPIREVTVAEWEADVDNDAVPDMIGSSIIGPDGQKSCLVGMCAEARQAGLIHMPRMVNTVILLDASGSMADEVKPGMTKMEAAKKAIRQYVDAVPTEKVFQTGLVVFGHKGPNTREAKPQSCDAVEAMVPLGVQNHKEITAALDKFEPSGWTPIEPALKKAAEMLPKEEFMANRIIIVSDGLERCGGQPLETAKNFMNKGVFNRIDVIGFEAGEVEDLDFDTLQKMASLNDRGQYMAAGDVDQFDAAFGEVQANLVATRQAWMCGVRNAEELQACYRDFEREATMAVREQGKNIRVEGIEEDEDFIDETVSAISTGVDRLVGEVAELSREIGSEIDEEFDD